MALTEFQRSVCRLIAKSRLSSGESYVAGGAALNELLRSPRVSRDVDLFHDTESALAATFQSDKDLLERAGFGTKVLRERPSYVEAEVTRGGHSVLLQWVRDSAFRFFPLVEHEELGLVLHPFDLATNKVLALVGRLEVRDWVDVIECDERLQPFGYLAWAATGKDPGFSPMGLIEHAARSAHYSVEEVQTLAFEGPPPDARVLSQRWRAIMARGREIVSALPAEHAGMCILDDDGALCTTEPSELPRALASGKLVFRGGSIRGALPTLVRT